MKNKALLAAVISLFALASGSEVFADTNTSTDVSSQQENTITVFENTPIISDGITIGIIAPQTVPILETRQIHVGHGFGHFEPAYLINTWLGKALIMPDNALLGKPISVDTDLELYGVETVYSDPGLTKNTGMKLAPQTVHVKAKWENRYMIDTMFGDRWISPRYLALTNVKKVQQEIQLKTTTKLFRSPYSGSIPQIALAPQKVTVNEIWQDWYHVDSWIGPVWVKIQ